MVGVLTYAANWWKEYEAVTFWNALDYVGIQGYFELSTEEDPSHGIASAKVWESHKAAMKALVKPNEAPCTLHGTRLSQCAWMLRRSLGDGLHGNESMEVQPADALQARLFDGLF